MRANQAHDVNVEPAAIRQRTVDPTMPRVPKPSSIDVSAVDGAFHDRLLAAIDSLTDPSRIGEPWVVTPMSGGATNLNFRVQTGDLSLAMRVCGGDIERRVACGSRAHGAEIQTAVAAGGVGVPLHAYALPEGHLLAEFIDNAIALNLEEMRSRNLVESMARLVRRLHNLPAISCTWSAVADIEHYRQIADREGLPLPDDIDELQAAAADIDRLTGSVPGAYGMCHNDLQIQNFLFDGQRLWLVDWEWGGMGNRYFDLGAVLVNSNCTREESELFCRTYFGESADIEAELARAHLMTVTSAIREGLWSVAAAPVLPNDWDYDAWAATYFGRARAIVHSDQYRELTALAAPRPAR